MEIRPAGRGTNANAPRSKPVLWWRWGRPPRKACSAKITPINKSRGRPIDLDDGTKRRVTVHPSYPLRLPDADAGAGIRRFVEDSNGRRVAAKSARAAWKFSDGGNPKFLLLTLESNKSTTFN
jgi:DNA polymerase